MYNRIGSDVCCRAGRCFSSQRPFHESVAAGMFAPRAPRMLSPEAAATAAAAAAAAVTAAAAARAHRAPAVRRLPGIFTLEAMVLRVMHMRERFMSLRARSAPDDSAKLETFKMVTAGKEHPAIRAYKSGRCARAPQPQILFPWQILYIVSHLEHFCVLQQGQGVSNLETREKGQQPTWVLSA
jgi:hypothetical protein